MVWAVSIPICREKPRHMPPTANDYEALSKLPYFTYGSLMDDQVFALVSGMALPTDARLAWAQDRKRTRFAKQSYPIMSDSAGDRVFGLLVPALPAQVLARIHAYESEDYRLEPLTVASPKGTEQAVTFMPTGRAEAGSAVWHMSQWRADAKPMIMWIMPQINAKRDQLTMADADALFDALELEWLAR